MLLKPIVGVLLFWLGHLAVAQTPPMRDATRGELLYTTHCIACHSTEVHWRDKKLVTDPTSLHAQVRHWQSYSGLGWGGDDVAEVARYLNVRYYHFSTLDLSGAGASPVGLN